jgi:hypothetical protein
MKKYNKLDKTFGGKAFIGQFLFFYLLYLPFHELIFDGTNIFDIINKYATDGSIFVFICISPFFAFFGFTATYTKIDYANKRIKYLTRLLGIIPIGKWTYLSSDMKLGLKESTEGWVGYSVKGGFSSLNHTDLKIYLYNAEYEEIIPVKKVKKAKFAEEELEKLSKLLELSIL